MARQPGFCPLPDTYSTQWVGHYRKTGIPAPKVSGCAPYYKERPNPHRFECLLQCMVFSGNQHSLALSRNKRICRPGLRASFVERCLHTTNRVGPPREDLHGGCIVSCSRHPQLATSKFASICGTSSLTPLILIPINTDLG